MTLRAALLWALVLLFHHPSVAVAHECMHDKIPQPEPQFVEHLSRRGARTLAFEPIRIKMLFDESYSCTGNGTTVGCWCKAVGDVVATLSPAWAQTCTAAGVVTDAKRKYIQQVINEAVAWIQGVFSVERGPAALSLAGNTMCGSVTVPAAHKSPGVANTDLIIYAVIIPVGGRAAAKACINDGTNGRPVAGVFYFDAATYAPADLASSKHEANVKTAIHEIFHILGFQGYNFRAENFLVKDMDWFGGVSPLGPNGEIRSPEVLKQTRAHFGCNTLTGAAIENQGSPGSAGGHWETRVFGNEAMAARSSAGMFQPFSKITLALFKDTGVYGVDYSKAEELWWGKGKGCAFASPTNTKSCSQNKNWEEFCWKDNTGATITAAAVNAGRCQEAASSPCLPEVCTFTLQGQGVCWVKVQNKDLSLTFQQFTNPRLGGAHGFTDSCPVVSDAPIDREQAYGVCIDELPDLCSGITNGTTCAATENCHFTGSTCINFLIDGLGNTYGRNSRCFPTNNLMINSRKHVSKREPRCFRVSCTASNYTIEVGRVKAVACPAAGGAITVAGFSGTVNCWPHNVVCTGRGQAYTGKKGTTATPTPTPVPVPSSPQPPSAPAFNHSCSETMVAWTAACRQHRGKAGCTGHSCVWCGELRSCLYVGEACGRYELNKTVVNYTAVGECPKRNAGGVVAPPSLGAVLLAAVWVVALSL